MKSFKISPNTTHDEGHDESHDDKGLCPLKPSAVWERNPTEEEETKEEPKYKIIIASYTHETFYRVPKHINAEDCFIKYGTLQYEDDGELIEDDKFIASEGDDKYPSELTDASYEDFGYFFE